MLQSARFWLLVATFAATIGVSQQVTIHLASHTHDDTGWLKTVDQYHYGANTSIQYAGTQYILESVVQGLLKDRRRKFVYVEQAYLYRWWVEQDDATKNDVRMLVNEGRLQFANGGWCMHDEAATYYIDMIDQTALGHRLLKNELNAIPLIGWQIDPFGHSSTQAALLSVFSGFLATYHGRADYQDYNNRCNMRTREFIWRASESLPYASLLGGVLLGNQYQPPGVFAWDARERGGNPIHGDKRLNEYDLPHRVEEFVTRALNDAAITLGNNVLWTMGSDFNYMDANFWFHNLDQLIKAVNADGRVRAVYSTPLDYTIAKLQENLNWTTKTDDFFPYEDGPHQFWTGYYTSRAAFKRFVRDMSGFYTMGRQLAAITSRPNSEMLPAMGQAMGLAQHHDAVTGTSKQHVVFDYAQRLNIAKTAMEGDIGSEMQDLLGSTQPFVMCPLANQSECAITSAALSTTGTTLTVAVWNQLAQTKTRIVRIPVPHDAIDVEGSSVVSWSTYRAASPVTNYARTNADSLPFTLALELTLPPLGYSTFTVKSALNSARRRHHKPSAGSTAKGSSKTTPLSISNGVISLSFDSVTGRIASVKELSTGKTTAISQKWCYYESNVGDSVWGQASGAYIFRPVTNSTCIDVSNTTVLTQVISQGPVEAVVEQQFADWVTQRVRLPNGTRHFEVEFTIGPIPIADGWGKEVVSHWTTGIQNQATWATDANGRELQRRVRNFRPTWNFTQTEPVAGNYYPVNAMIEMHDQDTQLSVLVDASNGGGSIEDGELEIMVFRRLLQDDGRGVAEPLDETQFAESYYPNQPSSFGLSQGFHYGPGLIVRGVHTVLVSTPAEASSLYRPLMDEVYAQSRPLFASGVAILANKTFLQHALPANIQLTTLELLNSSTLLFRLAHQFAVTEDPAMAVPVTIDLSTLFDSVGFQMLSFEEMNLSANQKLSEMVNVVIPPSIEPGTWKVTISPMEVRTYLINVVA